MKEHEFTIVFYGKKLGAIGLHERFTAKRIASDSQEAIRKLYDEYEHIMQPEVTTIKRPNPKENRE